jgi:hypothetical protein
MLAFDRPLCFRTAGGLHSTCDAPVQVSADLRLEHPHHRSRPDGQECRSDLPETRPIAEADLPLGLSAPHRKEPMRASESSSPSRFSLVSRRAPRLSKRSRPRSQLTPSHTTRRRWCLFGRRIARRLAGQRPARGSGDGHQLALALDEARRLRRHGHRVRQHVFCSSRRRQLTWASL